MKTVKEIAKLDNLIISLNSELGGKGKLVYGSLRNCSVIWTREDNDADNYHKDHVSICPTGRLPTWDELCKVKDMFFYDEEECYQVFPKKSEYVNLMKNCLHIWHDRESEHNEQRE